APTVCVRITCALSAFALACYGALRLSRKRLNERGRDGMLAAAPPRANRHAFHTDTYPLARYARSGWRVEAPVSPPGWGRARVYLKRRSSAREETVQRTASVLASRRDAAIRSRQRERQGRAT